MFCCRSRLFTNVPPFVRHVGMRFRIKGGSLIVERWSVDDFYRTSRVMHD